MKNQSIEKLEKAIKFLVQRIVVEVHPLRVLLFGSIARGVQNENSDIDLLVIMPEGIHRRKTAQKLYQNIEGVGVPFDLIVATESDLKKHKNNIGLIYKSAMEEGRELYAS